MTKIGVITFPGSLDDVDAQRAVRAAGAEPVALWHASDSVDGVDAIVLPGGFAHGDYLRAGALARFSPIMAAVADEASRGTPILGLGNGFQVLCEAGLLDGVLLRNAGQQFISRPQRLRVETKDTVWTVAFERGQEITLALKHGEGNFQAPAATLQQLEDNDQVVLRYLDNPDGSANDIAGITNARGNVVGIMPHPEYSVDDVTGPSSDGRPFFESVLRFLSVRA
ncbi:MAG: phosphoribosylformylglycinamidine synthase subunit PurQ [Propionibacterium sp.]|nr:phosphoribosylformylglycinamidine synthase subunit PurQ [Propionibacterium sp.]